MKTVQLAIATVTALSVSSLTLKVEAAYVQTNLVSNNSAYNPVIVDPLLQGSRSIAIRPTSAGFGGHFWINNFVTGTNTVYVGDVGGTPIFQDSLKVVTLPPSTNNPAPLSLPTGQVFNGSQDFVITQSHPNGPITRASKFLFASLDGTITAWTDRKRADGTSDWPTEAIVVIDRFGASQYQGLTVSDLPTTGNRLYAVDFGLTPGIEVFDGNFHEITAQVNFINPFASDGYQAYNIQTFNGSLYVTYAQPSATLGEGLAGTGLGRLARFDFDGNLLDTWNDGGFLNLPAGMAIAPADFGEFSNALLVANFGDGTIAAFDQNTFNPLGYLRNSSGRPVVVPGIWGLTFGNGKSLGELNDLYFSAAPDDGSNDGLFGKLEAVPEPDFVLALLAISGMTFLSRQRR
jgi:uncharacterized protein (TIGR03118 family)